MFEEVLKLIEKLPGFEAARAAIVAVEEKFTEHAKQLAALWQRFEDFAGTVDNLERRLDSVAGAVGDFKLMVSTLGKNPGEVAGPADPLPPATPEPWGLRRPRVTAAAPGATDFGSCPVHPESTQNAAGCTMPGCVHAPEKIGGQGLQKPQADTQ
jgi:hypothetical protein